MIPINEGKKLIQETIYNDQIIEIEISKAVGYALANDLYQFSFISTICNGWLCYSL